MLPWDGDIDTQISIATLEHLSDIHNNTMYSYTSQDSKINPKAKKEASISRQYHLDVNPAIYTRYRNKGENVIDARWIDVRNGLYIDITAVAETEPKNAPGIWACKNYHRYKTRDLWPMRESIYEGVVAKVPYAYESILSEEYGEKALVLDEYEGHMWDSVDHVWAKKAPGQTKQKNGNQKTARRKKQEKKAEDVKEQYMKEKDAAIAKEAQLQNIEGKEREKWVKEAQSEGLEEQPTKNRIREKRWLRKDVSPGTLHEMPKERHLGRLDL